MTSLAPTAPTSSRPRLRGAFAVFAGLFSTFAVTTAVDVVLHLTGVFPPLGSPPMSNGLFAVALAYRLVLCTGGSYLTARLAPDRPLRHAMILGGIGLCLSIIGAVTMWDFGPGWYPIAIAVSALPCAYAGGRLFERSH